MEILGITSFVLRIGNAGYPVALEAIGPDGAMHLRARSGAGMPESSLQKKASIHFSLGGQPFLCQGEAYCTETGQVAFQRKSDVIADRRREPRFEMPRIPARIVETRLLRRHEVSAVVRNLSKSGARFETAARLSPEREHTFETRLGAARSPDVLIDPQDTHYFLASIEIRNWTTEQGVSVYGARFRVVSPKHAAALARFIQTLEQEMRSTPAR